MLERRLVARASVGIAVALGVLLGAVVACGLGWAALVVEAAAICSLLLIERHAVPVIRRVRQGRVGEEQVGEILDRLRPHGWLALHDIPTGRGNIDHVIVGPAGVFTVETKSHPGRICAGRIDSRMLRQAYAQAKFFERIVDVTVQPLLIFSRAYLTPAVSRRQGVVILPARMLAGHLARRESGLTAEEAAALHARLAAALSA